MSRPGLRGARRTRIYDSNYNASQNYYKPALDNLDRKYYGRFAYFNIVLLQANCLLFLAHFFRICHLMINAV